MDEFLYLEADEEITSVIDKLKGLESNSVGLVAPKGSSIVQSLVSLKLLAKQATALEKDLAIVTADEVGQNLAAQVGLTVYSDVKSKKPLEIVLPEEATNGREIKINDAETEGLPTETKESLPAEERVDSEKPSSSVQSPSDRPAGNGIEVHRYDESQGELDQESDSEALMSPDMEKKISASHMADNGGSERDSEKEHFESNPVAKKMDEKEQTSHGLAEGGFSRRHVGSFNRENQNDAGARHALEAERPLSRENTEISRSNKNKKRKWKAVAYVVGTVLGIALLGFINLLAAKMNINLEVEAAVFDQSFDVTVAKDHNAPDLAAGIIGGTQIIKEKTFEDSFVSTGKKNAGEKAKGTLTFKNESGTDETINSGTTVRSSSGVEFVLDNAITVPKAQLNADGDKILGQNTGAVTAKEIGANGNLPSGTSFSVYGKSKISATGSTTGGVTKEIKIVTKSDIDKAKEQLKSKKATDFIEDSDKQKDTTVLEDAGLIDVIEFSVDKNVGDEAEKINAKAKLKFTTLLFKMEDLRSAAVALAEKSLPEGKGLVLTDTDSLTSKLKEDKNNVGQMIVEAKIVSHVGPKMDLASLVKSWRGKPIKKIRDDLSKIEGVTLSSLDLKPKIAFPVGPILTRNIKVNVGYLEK